MDYGYGLSRRARKTINDLGTLRLVRANAGAAQSTLTGVEWVVEDIVGNDIIDSSRATLNFDWNERMRGRASCNSYTSPYELNGEQIKVGTIAATLMACAPALNNQEDEFLKLLHNARSFETDDTGKLIIRAESGDTLEVYRAG